MWNILTNSAASTDGKPVGEFTSLDIRLETDDRSSLSTPTPTPHSTKASLESSLHSEGERVPLSGGFRGGAEPRRELTTRATNVPPVE